MGGSIGKSNKSTTPQGAPLWGDGALETSARGSPENVAGSAVGVGVGVAVGVGVGVGVCVAVRVGVEV